MDGIEAVAVDHHRTALHQRGLDVGDREVGVKAGRRQGLAVKPGDARQSRRRRALQQREAGLDWTKPWPVLTTTTETKPWPKGIVAGTGTVSLVAERVAASGVSGPLLTGPVEVLTKKLTSEPLVKPLPLIRKLAPASTGLCTELICGWPGTGVGVGVGTVGLGVVAIHSGAVGVAVGVGVRVGVGVCVGIGVCVTIGVGISVCVGVGLGVEVAVAVGLGVNVGTEVGGAVTLKPTVAVAGSKAELPSEVCGQRGHSACGRRHGA